VGGAEEGQTGQDVTQPGEGVEIVALGAAGHAEEDRCGAATAVAAAEQPVLATDRARFHRPLGRVVVDRQFAVLAVADERLPI
jgi:hypothetical protein